MFNQKGQDEITSNFLDVVKVHDYFRELKEKRQSCRCKDCQKKHERNSTLYELPLPENAINNIYGCAYFCRDCQTRRSHEEWIKKIIRLNKLHEYDVDRIIFKFKHNFPIYDRVKISLFKKLSKKKIYMSQMDI